MDVVVPLAVPLEQFVVGARRQVQLDVAQLPRALRQETFEVHVPVGAPDGHQVRFPGAAGGGDVVFVLQARGVFHAFSAQVE